MKMMRRRTLILRLFFLALLSLSAVSVWAQEELNDDEVSLDEATDAAPAKVETAAPSTITTTTKTVEEPETAPIEPEIAPIEPEIAPKEPETTPKEPETVAIPEPVKEEEEEKVKEIIKEVEPVQEKAKEEPPVVVKVETEEVASTEVAQEGKSFLQKAVDKLKCLDKKKLAAAVLGVWGVSLGVGWLTSRGASSTEPLKAKM